ncbi:MAG: hypothetical protein HOV79_35050 [Hamadaea sp.]|nr:hypothetical protein [Hamadaea sp.]
MVSEVSSWLLAMLPGLLLLLAYLGGFAAALAQRRRLGKAAVPAALGTGILVLGGVVGLAALLFSLNLPQIMRDSAMSYSEISLIFSVVGLLDGLLHLVGVVLLLVAVFAGRTPTPSAAPAAPGQFPPAATYPGV